MTARRILREAVLLAAVVALALAGLVAARVVSEEWSAWPLHFVRYPLASWFRSDPGGLVVPILVAIAPSYSLRLLGAVGRRDDEALPWLAALVAASMVATVLAAGLRVVRLRGEAITALEASAFRALAPLEAEATTLTIAGAGALILALLLGGVGGAVARRRGGGPFALAAVVAATVIASVTAFAVAHGAHADLVHGDPCADPDTRTRILYEAFAAHAEPLADARSWLFGTAIAASLALIAVARSDRAPAPGKRALFASAAMFGLGLVAFGWTRGVAHDADHPPPLWNVSERTSFDAMQFAASDGSEDCVDGPHLSLQGDGFSLDGVGFLREQLAEGLVEKRALWRQVQPNRPFAGNLLVTIPEDASMATVAPVLEGARAVGYPRIIALRQVPPRHWQTRTLGDLAYRPRLRCTAVSPALALPEEGTWGGFVDRAARARR